MAALALGRLRDGRALGKLLAALHDPDVAVRIAAARALGLLGDRRAADTLRRSLCDWPSFFKADCAAANSAAANSLARLGEPEWADALVAVGNLSPSSLAGWADPRARDLLLSMIRQEGGQTAQHAARELGRLGEKRAVEPLVVMLAADSSQDREAAAWALGELRDGRGASALVETLGDSNARVRVAAAEALAKLGEPLWRPMVRGDDGDWQRLGASGDRRAAEPLRLVLVQCVRTGPQAAMALAQLGEREWEALQPDRDGYWDRLRASKDPRLTAPLIRELTTGDSPQGRALAATILGDWRDARAVQSLVSVLRDYYAEVGSAAAIALAQIGDPCAVGPLLEALASPQATSGVATALGMFGDEVAIEPLIGALSLKRKGVQRAAAKALVAIYLRPDLPQDARRRIQKCRAKFRTPHEDHSVQRASDCAGHVDTGIGIDFPAPPSGGDF